VKLCAALNAQGASYIVVGGMAVIQQGFLRATEDIDLLLENSRQNQAKVRKALEILPDKAVRKMSEDDLDVYHVVRVADEIVVDLMLSACGIAYADATDEVESVVIHGVPIPFASAKLLLRMKQTYRDKDIPDRIFLQEKLGARP
jgi:hypothetical protein